MKTIAFVPVRLTSTRLPRKHLRLIGDKPLLWWVIKRLKDSKELDSIVVCSPDEPDSKELEGFCDREGVELYLHPGDVNDVVGRLTTAAKIYGADICVLASGDCPLLSTSSIEKLIRYLKEHPDVGRVLVGPAGGKEPIHEGFNVDRRWVWELADRYSDTPELREHQFPVIEVYSDKFSHLKTAEIVDDPVYYEVDHRISVDTPDDLIFMNALYDGLMSEGREFNLENVIDILKSNPQLMEINRRVHQKELKEKTYKVLMIVSAVSGFGYGNLIRAIDVALELVDIGIGVDFSVLDSEARSIVEERYFKCDLIENIENVVELSTLYDVFIFDLNKDVLVERSIIEKLKTSGRKVVFIDNVKGGAELADKIIMPTAHYSGEEFSNLVHGPEFVVIRREVKGIRRRLSKKEGTLIRVDDRFKEHAKALWPHGEVVEAFDSGFVERLAESSLAVLNLGVSCYEALYLETMPIIVPRGAEESSEIKRFYSFALSEGAASLGDGATNIATVIKRVLKGEI